MELLSLVSGLCTQHGKTAYHIPVQRSSTKFGLMGLDQSQEHNVKHLKDGGSIKGLKIGENEVIEISRPDIQKDALRSLKTAYILIMAIPVVILTGLL